MALNVTGSLSWSLNVAMVGVAWLTHGGCTPTGWVVSLSVLLTSESLIYGITFLKIQLVSLRWLNFASTYKSSPIQFPKCPVCVSNQVAPPFSLSALQS